MAHTQTDRTVFHVGTRDGKWVVTRERRPDGEFDSFETKDEAIARARGEALNQAPSIVKVHGSDGAIECEYPFDGER
jgi:hypothetical protein